MARADLPAKGSVDGNFAAIYDRLTINQVDYNPASAPKKKTNVVSGDAFSGTKKHSPGGTTEAPGLLGATLSLLEREPEKSHRPGFCRSCFTPRLHKRIKLPPCPVRLI